MTVTVTNADRTLAAAQPLTMIGFSAAFHAMQKTAEPVPLAALSAGNSDEVQAAAFAWAREKGLVYDLINEINSLQISTAFVAACKETLALEPGDELQSIINPNDPFLNPVGSFANLPFSCLQTCKVIIDGEAAGTGFLVAPTVVATAHHVVERLTRSQDGKFFERENSAARLRFAFGDFVIFANGAATSREPKIVPAAANWLIEASSCHESEKLRLELPNAQDLAGKNDFALCRLSSILGIGFNGLPIETTAQLGAFETKITILQHPKGRPLKYHRETALKADAPRYRVSHRVNTMAGSSGAPCLNDDMRVVGIHQAGPENGPYIRAGANAQLNRCIPISWMQKMIDAAVMRDEPGLMPLAKLPDGHFVLGRTTLSDWVYRNVRAMAQDGTPGAVTSSAPLPILAVLPGELPGQRFTGRLLRALLPESRHRVVVLDTCELEGLDSLTALRLLWDLCQLPVGTLLPPEGNTTMIAHLKHKLVKQFCDALSAPADPRPTWIMLNGYNDLMLDSREGGTWDLLNLLFMAAGPANRLFFVLTGYTSTQETPDLHQRMQTEILTPPTADEIANVCRVQGRGDHDQAIKAMISVMVTLCGILPGRELYPPLLKALENLR